MSIKKTISLKEIEEDDPALVALWEVADATFDALECLLRDVGHVPIQNDRERESVRRWTLYLGGLFVEGFHASTLLAVASTPRAQIIIDRQLFEYSIRNQWLMKHPDEATRLLDSLQGFVQKELRSSSKLFDAATRASLEQNYEEWRRDHVELDAKVSSRESFTYVALVLPGGAFNSDALRAIPEAVAFAKAFFDDGKPVAAICHAFWTLVEAGVLRGRTVTSWPSIATDIRNAGGNWVDREVVVDGNLISSRKPDDIPAFNEKLLEAIALAKQPQTVR